ncbi:hypothetical protein [Rhodococcoides fascians]|uniref:hypothetical protein n=1 Tax=Rhodococcoides fascians TaxID=1828 RepID=UPI000AEEF85C|nr:hypothetical protein [Rhodococcus fascians]
MPEHKMVVVDGVRYRPGDVPDGPRSAAVPEPAAGDANKSKAKTSAKAGTGGGNRS